MLCFWISFSRSAARRRATDWTRPALRASFEMLRKVGLTSQPTTRSSTRRACWASTRRWSKGRGSVMAFCTASLVTAWKTTRL
ncbi:MAG TPA: hypothetical protein DCZ01_08250 [Elusimicrobia bacterium]|nr:hypothetical protein [Elusimicrobiota bacterium]